MAIVETSILLVIAAGYFIGSIPFGFLVAKIRNINIQLHGSGNIGATNVFRLFGPFLGTTVFILDLSKGALPVFLAGKITENHWLIVLSGAAAILGHIFSIFLRFKGGRGSATGLGVLLGVAPDIFAGAMLLAVILILITRYVSVASIVVPVLVAVAFLAFKHPLPYIIAASLVAVLIITRHIPNIKRLLAGTEFKIGEGR